MLWEKGEVNSGEHHEELGLRAAFPQRCPGDGRKPECHTREDSEDGPHREHVVEMRHYVVGIV